MKDWYLGHFEECEYCYRVDESIVFDRAKKDKLIDEHTMDSFGNYASGIHDAYADYKDLAIQELTHQ